MNKISKISIGLITILALSACSTQSNRTQSDKANTIDSNNVSNSTSNVNDNPSYENGLGETQIERYKIIVLPAQIDLTTQNSFVVSPSALSQTLSHEITSALYETHRFDILSSDSNLDSTENEATDASLTKADFYLKSTLNQLDTEQTVRILKATGQGVEEKTVSTTVLYQIIDAKTDHVVQSRTLRYQLKSTTFSESYSTTINNTLKSVANLIKNEIINELYPIRVIEVSNNGVNYEVTLDQPLAVGSICEITRLGKKIKDTYTDSLLGYEQKVVGKAAITRSSSVIAYGELIEGNVSKGDICKPQQATILSAPELIKRTPQGGVVLPFD